MADICLQEDLNDERDPASVTNYLIQKVRYYNFHILLKSKINKKIKVIKFHF